MYLKIIILNKYHVLNHNNIKICCVIDFKKYNYNTKTFKLLLVFFFKKIPKQNPFLLSFLYLRRIGHFQLTDRNTRSTSQVPHNHLSLSPVKHPAHCYSSPLPYAFF